MRKMGVKQGLLGAVAAAAVLAGCDDRGRVWSLTAQEDYYPAQAQDEVGRARSNLETTSRLFETNEQERGGAGDGEGSVARELDDSEEAAFSVAPEPREGGTGGAGTDERDRVATRIQGSAQEQEHLWLQQDARTPYPPPPIYIPLGTGKPLRTGPNGAWVQGTYAVELGANAGRPGGVAPLGGPGIVTPRPQPEGSEVAPPQQPTTDNPERQWQ